MNRTKLKLDIGTAISLEYPNTRDEKDVTLYWNADTERFDEHWKTVLNPLLERHENTQRGSQGSGDNSVIEEQVLLYKGPIELGLARASLCLAYGGNAISGTFREFNAKEFPPCLKHSIVKWPERPASSGYLSDASKVATFVLNKCGFGVRGSQAAGPPSGLILLAGSTKSGKTHQSKEIAIQIMEREVQQRFEQQGTLKSGCRAPHLVTFEDPIESWPIQLENASSDLALTPSDIAASNARSQALPLPFPVSQFLGFNFTPRQRGRDVPDLKNALLQAKRQTPTCFYIGELREAKDWKHVLEFAGSGHLVVGTTHAGSLVEMIARIFRAVRAKTPGDRRSVAANLLACIHLEMRDIVPDQPDSPSGSQKISDLPSKRLVMPSLWLRTGVSLSGLVADGLSSIIPDGSSIWSRSQIIKDCLSNRTLGDQHNDQIPWAKYSLREALRIDSQELRRQ